VNISRRARHIFATWGGLGYSPVAPGTVGSLATLPLHYALCLAPLWAHILTILAIFAFGVHSAQVVAEDTGNDDPSWVVIDEVVGTLLALVWVRDAELWVIAIAFLSFRVLDILKPPPIRQAEHMQPTGLGIVLDDVIAGLVAGAFAVAISLLV
jgi:phosphatidylglycerophosphatase A